MSIEINKLKCLITNIIKVPIDELNKYRKNFSYFTKNDIKNIKSFDLSPKYSNKKNLLILYIYNDYLIYIIKNYLGLDIDYKLIIYNKKEHYIKTFYLERIYNKFYISYFITTKNYFLFDKFIQSENIQYTKNNITIIKDFYLNKKNKNKNIFNKINSNFEIEKNYIDNIHKCSIYYLEDKTICINYFYFNYKIYKLYELYEDDEFIKYKLLQYDSKYIKLNSNIYIFI